MEGRGHAELLARGPQRVVVVVAPEGQEVEPFGVVAVAGRLTNDRRTVAFNPSSSTAKRSSATASCGVWHGITAVGVRLAA